MSTLNYADKIALGGQYASAVYAGSVKVWPLLVPTSIAGCVIWLDASKLTMADGAAVSAWPNLGSGPQPTILGSPAPVLRKATNGLNGLPVVRITATQGRVRFTGTGVDKDYTLVYVARKWSLRAGRVVAASILAANTPNILWGFWSDRFECAYVEGWMIPDTVVTATTQWRLYSGDTTATGTARLFSNGVQIRSHPTPPAAKGLNGTLNICGHDDTSTEDADCEIAELVLYNRKLSDAERQSVESYLRVKWNAISLFKPTDLVSNLTNWFDASNAASILLSGSSDSITFWTSSGGVGSMSVMQQTTEAYKPRYSAANKVVTFLEGTAFQVSSCPSTFDMIWVGKPRPASVANWRTLLRNGPNAHEIIVEANSTRIGTYHASVGFVPATIGLVGPTNMTSNTTPAPYVASASETHSAPYEPFYSFDGNAGTYSHSARPLVTVPYWIQIDLGSPKRVTHYVYQPRPDGATTVPYQQWYSWSLAGSNDATNWTTVDIVPSVADFAWSERRVYACDIVATFRYWRWTVTVGTGYDPAYASAAALELYDSLEWDNVWGIGCARFGAAPVSMSRDGGPMISTGYTMPAADIPFVSFGAFQGPPPSQAWGDIKEVIFLPYNLEGARQMVEGYLAWKWGLVDLLPASHPHKLVAP
jgi:hypothetical protein